MGGPIYPPAKTTLTVVEPPTHATYSVVDAIANANEYNFPSLVRPQEPSRKSLRVQNLGTTSVQLGYSVNGPTNYNGPGSWTITLPVGKEYIEPVGTAASLFARPATSGQAFRIGVYCNLGRR